MFKIGQVISAGKKRLAMSNIEGLDFDMAKNNLKKSEAICLETSIDNGSLSGLPPGTTEKISNNTSTNISNSVSNSTHMLRRLLLHTLWAESPCLSAPSLVDLADKRIVQKRLGIDCGELYSKKLERLVHYKSALERSFFQTLEHSGDVLWYLEQPIKVRYQQGRQPAIHVPDAILRLRQGQYVVIEVKPVADMLAHASVDKFLALRGYCTALGWGLLITDGEYSFMELAEHIVPSGFAAEMRAQLQKGPMTYSDFKPIERLYTPSKLDFLALVLQQDLDYTASPLRLALRGKPVRQWRAGRPLRM